MLTRRYFIRASAITVAGAGLAPSWLVRAASPGEGKKKILISIFQRGAADGLNIVVPFSEKRYYDLRPTIAIPAPGKPNGALDLDGRFAFHPALQQLKPLWDGGQLAIVHAAGSPEGNRSHFEAQDQMESGTPGRTMEDGWLNRALPRCHALDFSNPSRRNGSEDAAYPSRQSWRNIRERSSAVSGTQSGRCVRSSKACTQARRTRS